MSACYKCKRCKQIDTKYFNNMKKHLNRKILCVKKSENVYFSDDQILVLSLMPYYNNRHSITEKDIMFLKNSTIMDNNKKELFDLIDDIEINKCKICKFCNNEFSLVNDLKKHILTSCFYNDLLKRQNTNNNETNNNRTTNNETTNHINNSGLFSNNNSGTQTINTTNITNTTNTNNINNNINNINIYLDVKSPVPFDEDWDISQISEYKRTNIMVSKYMYTQLLEEILKNEINLNVIIDKDNDSGMVYKNDLDKYIQMKLNDIVANTMEKLNKHLNDINKSDTNAFKDIITVSRREINKKFIDYKKNDNIHNTVNDVVCNIFDSEKIKAIGLAEKVVKNPHINNDVEY